MHTVRVGNREVGEGKPCFIIAEIGINHDGDVDVAKRLIDVAVSAGCDAVKFQKRTPDLHVAPDKRDVLRDTPWGEMRTIDYRERIEFGHAEYDDINEYCLQRGILWFASPWDVPSVDFLEQYNPPCYKIASAGMVNKALRCAVWAARRPVIMSTGMATLADIDEAYDDLASDRLTLLHCTSNYPTTDDEIDLPVIETLRQRYRVPVGYSGHEVGLLPSVLSVAAWRACIVERHVTLDRGRKGSDHGASIEPHGLHLLVRDIRRAERLREGGWNKRVHASEAAQIKRLRG